MTQPTTQPTTNNLMMQLPPRVSITLGYKVNMGNFETLNVEFSVEDSQRSTEDSVDATAERIYKYVENKLLTKVREVKAELAGG